MIYIPKILIISINKSIQQTQKSDFHSCLIAIYELIFLVNNKDSRIFLESSV